MGEVVFHLAVCATLFNHTNTRNLASWAGRLHNSTTAEPCIIVRARAAARSTPSRYCYRACTRHGRAGVTRRRCAKTLQCEALRCNRPRTLAGAARGPACPQTATWSRRRAWPSGLYFQWAWTGDWTKHQCCDKRRGTATRVNGTSTAQRGPTHPQQATRCCHRERCTATYRASRGRFP